jgi:hypothetical protein
MKRCADGNAERSRMRHTLVRELTADYDTLAWPGNLETTLYIYPSVPVSLISREDDYLFEQPHCAAVGGSGVPLHLAGRGRVHVVAVGAAVVEAEPSGAGTTPQSKCGHAAGVPARGVVGGDGVQVVPPGSGVADVQAPEESCGRPSPSRRRRSRRVSPRTTMTSPPRGGFLARLASAASSSPKKRLFERRTVLTICLRRSAGEPNKR